MRKVYVPAMVCNFDPSYLFGNSVDPVVAIRKLGDTIVHVHAKDGYIVPNNAAVNGWNNHKNYNGISHRSLPSVLLVTGMA